MSLRRQAFRLFKSASLWMCCLAIAALGSTCPFLGGDASPFPTPTGGNTAPRLQITNVVTDFGNNFVQQGDPVVIQFNGSDAEDASVARIFASQSANPTPAQQISISEGIEIGPGFGSGVVQWDTTNVPIGAYTIFGEIDDGSFDPLSGTGNQPVRVAYGAVISIAPRGSQPLNSPPRLTFLEPLANLGLSVQDEVTVRYIYADTDSNNVKITLLLDKDRIPTNDDVNNPGDPLDPASNIIILPSAVRLNTDPTFDGDPAPPVDLAQLQSADSIEIRTNPRTFGTPTVPGLLPFPGAPQDGEFKEYRFTIDFAQIPVRTQPYFLRATITDGVVTAHAYATGSITISSLASGLVDVGSLGFSLAGARFQGFSVGENLGSIMRTSGDLDGDGVDDFLIAGRFASPRNRFQSGAAYQIFGRSKLPFPLDTNGNGIPDVPGVDGTPIDFPTPPDYLPTPYNAANIGRFGGIISINSVGSFFRGTTYGMPLGRIPVPSVPGSLTDGAHPFTTSAGLTSIARLDVTADGIDDLVFGLPYVGGARDYGDDDPVEGGCDTPYNDGFPNALNCSQNSNDDLGLTLGGLVIMVDGTNNLVTNFPQFVDAGTAGQFDPEGIADDEGVAQGGASIPRGARLRGAYLDRENAPPIVQDNEYGRTVGVLPAFFNTNLNSLVISSPGFSLPGVPPIVTPLNRCGKIVIFQPSNFIADGFTLDGVRSFPVFGICPGGGCVGMNPTICCRAPIPMPNWVNVYGADAGDELGYAGTAGQFNQDGVADVLMGAPGADRRITAGGPVLTNNGVFYVLFTPSGGFGNSQLTVLDPDNPPPPGAPIGPPRLEIRGSHSEDRFGAIQTAIQDVNGDGRDDVAFASPSYDHAVVGADAGYVGIIFGNRPLTGENGFTPEQVGTASLAGVRFVGAHSGAMAGASIASAGDFNRDGYGDLLIACPGEVRVVNGVARKGVAYLIFGNASPTFLTNNSGQGFNLAQVGVKVGNVTPLPGIVFVSRFAQGTIDEAPLDSVGGLGDIDGDGFDDIGVAAMRADFVNPSSPNQRRDEAGEVYIIYGNNQGSNNLAGG